MGRSVNYLSKALGIGKLTKSTIFSLAAVLGITPEKLMEYMQEPKPEKPKEEPQGDEVLNMLTLIYEMEKRQVETLQRLNMMFERTWCK